MWQAEAAEKTALWASLVAGAWHRAAQAALAKPQAQALEGTHSSSSSSGRAKARHTLRRMCRKDVITAPYLDEWCSVYRDDCGGQLEGVSFTPVLPAWVEEESFRKPVMREGGREREAGRERCRTCPTSTESRCAMLFNTLLPHSLTLLL